jgi:hypothetical protein
VISSLPVPMPVDVCALLRFADAESGYVWFQADHYTQSSRALSHITSSTHFRKINLWNEYH